MSKRVVWSVRPTTDVILGGGRAMVLGLVRVMAAGILAVACAAPAAAVKARQAPSVHGDAASIVPTAAAPIVEVPCASAPAAARAPVSAWPPLSGQVQQVALWPGAAPDGPRGAAPEEVTETVTDHLVAGKPWVKVGRVSRPTITIYSPTGKNTGAAVVVFPGGGYHILAIDLEGTEVCDWLTSRGITCVLLKYRVPGEADDNAPYVEPTLGRHPLSRLALQDAQRAMGLLRSRAAQWGIDPHRLGVLGFSAGGHLVAAISTHFAKREYPAVDAADQQSCRPDFAVVLYAGHLSMEPKEFELTRDIPVTSETPPTFIVQSEDDPIDPVENSLVYFAALRKADVPAELHLYSHGGHAFGLRPRAGFPITNWPRLVETWLAASGVIAE